MLMKINLRLRFLPLKIAFLGGFENYNNLSSKSYMVTKSEISPQQKLGFLQNLKLKFIRKDVTTNFFFLKIRACTCAKEP